MRLVGLLVSPYVRRVAISLQLLGLRFEHDPLSVFRQMDEFARVNPVFKAPTLVTGDGVALMDSTLILEYAEHLARPRSLLPSGGDLVRDLRLTGLALAACEKCVQAVYEKTQRPAEKLHAPWLDRVHGQIHAAFGEAEREPLSARVESGAMTQGRVSIAVAWQFARQMLSDIVTDDRFPRLAALSAAAETLPEFAAAPHGNDACRRRS